MTWLAFFFALEMGFQSRSELLYNDPDWTSETVAAGYQIDSPYVLLQAEVIFFDFVAFGGWAQIYFADTESWMYAPYDGRFVFYFRGDVKLSRGLLLVLGWGHECIHPSLSMNRPDLGFLFGGGNKIYARIEAKVGGK